MAKIVGSVGLHTLKRRLNRNNVFHQEVLEDIERAIILKKKKKRTAQKSVHTNNVGTALRRAFLEKSIQGEVM